MSRRGSGLLVLTAAIASVAVGCGSTKGGPVITVPASISLTPGGTASLDQGATLQFSALAQDFNKRPITVPLSFSSSNAAVLTISTSGLACAGTWNSLAVPTVCTPGPAGLSQVTASSAGANSPPVTVYVHQHIDNISVAPIDPLPTACGSPASSSFVGMSQNQLVNLQATAFSRGNDVTATVGPFTWTQGNTTVVKLTTNFSGLLPNQIQNQAEATAGKPGLTQITASAAGVTSPPMNFETCPVQSITLQVAGTPETSFVLTKGGGKTVTATVVDTQGFTLTGVPLTWSSSEPAVLSVSSSGAVSALLVGGADVIASCIPPTCNPGIYPALPIYPNSAFAFTVTPTSTSGQPASQTTNAFATTTGCGANFGCLTYLFPITVPGNQPGSAVFLPNPPNSFVFDRQGKNGYLGSESGLMIFLSANVGTANSPISPLNSVTGKVLAVSPDGNQVIVSDTSANPNQVFIVTSPTANPTAVDLLITGATAAAFSPDNLKAYIVAGTTLYVYSPVEALKTVPLAAPAGDVTFLPMGAFAYLAGGASSAVTIRDICTNGVNPPFPQTLPTNGSPSAIRALLDGTHLLALDTPGIDVITAGTITLPAAPNPPCPPLITPGSTAFVNMGQGQFTPIKFLVSTDGTKAYILTSNLGSVLVYDVAAGTSSAIPLMGNVKPLSGDLSLDGTLLYVGATDGKVHVVSTLSGGDFQQIGIPAGSYYCGNVSYTCMPDLVVLQP